MNRFLCHEPLETDREVTLQPEESHHLAKVLRAKPGETIALVDGRGKLARATITKVGTHCLARIESVEVSSARSKISVCFGASKSQAFDFTIRRLTELGVQGFQPLHTANSLRLQSWNDRRWEKVIVEVSKQCQELNFPELSPPISLDEWLEKRDASRVLVFCDEADRKGASELDLSASGYDLLVGAEGGWSSAETEKIRSLGAVSFGLGRNRLRTEMAALVAAVLVKTAIGEI